MLCVFCLYHVVWSSSTTQRHDRADRFELNQTLRRCVRHGRDDRYAKLTWTQIVMAPSRIRYYCSRHSLIHWFTGSWFTWFSKNIPFEIRRRIDEFQTESPALVFRCRHLANAATSRSPACCRLPPASTPPCRTDVVASYVLPPPCRRQYRLHLVASCHFVAEIYFR